MEPEEIKQEETQPLKEAKEPQKPKKSKKGLIICILSVLVVAIAIICVALFTKDDKTTGKIKTNTKASEYRIKGNSLEDFDLYFLKLENEEINKIYSPLSIKFALAMLNEGTEGEAHEQIASIIGDYKPHKYVNSKNMSFANSLFIRDKFKESVKKDYVKKLKNKFEAEVIYDSFKDSKTINSWVENKTLGLVKDLLDDGTVQSSEFFLINALAIDMEWVKTIKPSKAGDWYVNYANENFSAYIGDLTNSDYPMLKFNEGQETKAVDFGAALNNYDIVSDLGEANIRKEVGDAYKKWLETDECGVEEAEKDVDKFLDRYIEELNSNYKKVSSSTDFMLYVDEEVKVFAKDLKEYNGTTLQYVGIMPIEEDLKSYIEDVEADDIDELIADLKEIKLENFKNGVITKIDGIVPLFDFEYKLQLKDDLQKLGIKNVFTPGNLTKLTDDKKIYIDSAVHKANIEFSNEGIKAAAATSMGGAGAASCGFRYNYDVPVEEIDLTFDKPYMFIIRDKNSGEVWFTGTVYEPKKYERRTY